MIAVQFCVCVVFFFFYDRMQSLPVFCSVGRVGILSLIL